MNYSKILKADIANGTGFRVSLFVSGCKRNCKGCFNPESHDPNFGKKFDKEAKEKIFAELKKDYCAGLSILGGEPMSALSDNRKQVTALAKEVKEKFPRKNIWMWTSYTLGELQSEPDTCDILRFVDVLVDGPFVESKKDLSLPFRGSSNQRILYRGKDF